jgi:hypothetical protein
MPKRSNRRRTDNTMPQYQIEEGQTIQCPQDQIEEGQTTQWQKIKTKKPIMPSFVLYIYRIHIYLKTSTMVTVIFMQSVMEIALPVKKLSVKNWSNLSGV